jgi:hypothetical protein
VLRAAYAVGDMKRWATERAGRSPPSACVPTYLDRPRSACESNKALHPAIPLPPWGGGIIGGWGAYRARPVGAPGGAHERHPYPSSPPARAVSGVMAHSPAIE